MRRFVALSILLGIADRVTAVGDGKFHPCRQQRPSVKKGNGFVVGFAFVANGNATAIDWLSSEDGPHPCVATDRDRLETAHVAVAYFNVEVDKLTLLDTPDQRQEQISSHFDNITVVAFSGGYRSESRVVRIREGEEWLVIRSLALIADFDHNGLRQFQWFDLECGECERGDRCLAIEEQKSCAAMCDLSFK